MAITNYTTLKKALLALATESIKDRQAFKKYSITSDTKQTTLSSSPDDTLLMLMNNTKEAVAGSIFIKRSHKLAKHLVRYSVEYEATNIIGVLVFTKDSNGRISIRESSPFKISEGRFVPLATVNNRETKLVNTTDGICFHSEFNKYFLADGPMYLINNDNLINIRFKLEITDNKLLLEKQIFVPNEYKYKKIHEEDWSHNHLDYLQVIVKLFNKLHYKKALKSSHCSEMISALDHTNCISPDSQCLEFMDKLLSCTPTLLVLKLKLPPNLHSLYIYNRVGKESFETLFNAYKSNTLDLDLVKSILTT